MRGRARIGVAFLALAGALAAAPGALADFPYARPGAQETDPTDLYVTDQVPSDLEGDSNEFKYAASPTPGGANSANDLKPAELGGVRGAHVVDRDASRPTAWKLTTGRPDVTIAVLDSGIKWNDQGAMNDLRLKTRLTQAELPVPLHTRADPLMSVDCGTYSDDHDANGDGVLNVADYACDPRIDLTDPRRDGPADYLTPQDVLIAFSNGDDEDDNGYVDDIVGWDYLDDDNDPYDDVQYGHGTGEAQGSASEADNGGAVGSCPNCMVIHMRVGDSFIADVNRFAQATIYATDNGAQVIQEALGTLNNSSFARDAVNYAYRHGVTVIASAADEAAQHNNWPSSLPHVILVNSVTRSPHPEPNRSYLAFNGCTNFNSKITLAIPSTSCSSDAVGVGSGLAGLVYSAAFNAYDKGALDANEECTLTGDGPDTDASGPDPCVITPNEVRQILASGTIDGDAQPDDVNFASPLVPGAEPSCGDAPAAGCTNPNAVWPLVDGFRPGEPPGVFRSYPARMGHDQFYGYGRVNMNRALKALVSDPEDPDPSIVPPEVELTSPEWYEQFDPARSSFAVRGEVFSRDRAFTCRVLVAPGHYPHNAEAPAGDYHAVPSPGLCDGTTTHTDSINGKLADVSVAALKEHFPEDATAGPAADFTGREPGLTPQTSNGRPANDPYGFVVKVVATTTDAGLTLTGEDQRASFLHRDGAMLDGFPKAIRPGGEVGAAPADPTSDGASSPAFADLDGDNRNEMIFGTSDGFVHALRPDGSELEGWPVKGDRPGFVASHDTAPAYASGEVEARPEDLGGAMLSSVAVADADRDGIPEVYVADLEGKVYGWDAAGDRVFEREANPAFSGAPLPGQPFVENRRGNTNRTQHSFIASPVLADLDGNDGGELEIVAAAMDRHLYVWERDGSAVDGFPLLVVDRSKVESIEPVTDRVTFRPDAGSEQQGAIIDTPAVGDLDGDADSEGEDELPEIVVGTNEEYRADQDGGFNAGRANTQSFNLLEQAGAALDACGSPCDDADILDPGNSRLYAIHHDGAAGGGDGIRDGWPAKIGILMTGLLPVVGEGITGSPVIAPAACSPGGDESPKVGTLANNGPAYILGADGISCYGRDDQGKDIALQSDVTPAPNYDHPVLPAVGHPAFGDLGEPSPSFLAPAAGINRALDLALPDYQAAGQDFVAAWSVVGEGQFRPGFPSPVNDLQFLTGPSVADIDPSSPGEEVLEGTASKDFTALSTAGQPADTTWPKVTTDWTVAGPLAGSFGAIETDEDARKVVVNLTRSGYLHVYETDADACAPASSPRFHHDNANSGDMRRDAVLPGKPTGLARSGDAIEFTAPGDDLLCDTAARYEIVTSDQPIDESSFAAATPLDGEPTPGEPGATESYAVPPSAERYVAVRAVDEQGNVGRVAAIDFGDPPDPSGPCSNLIAGTATGEELRGTGGSDRIKGRGGADTIRGRGGADCLRGGSGGDGIRGGKGADDVRGGKGADSIRGGKARDRLGGGDGDDEIASRGGGRDVVRCGDGDDVATADARDRVKPSCERVRRG